jgi:BirA family transcriptional regulator, biotin operon repressor / biotin---[acetyl-CoA-carboxylase] ligase
MSAVDILDRLIAAELQAQLGGLVIGREIVVLETTTSTNDSILQMTTRQTNEGLVIFAEHQTAGRGQRGNRWESAAHKGLWFSMLLRPGIVIDQSARLTAWLAQTVASTIENELSLSPIIKPPNDVYVNRRKVAGVLVEMRAQEKAPHFAIAGVGINVNQSPEDFSDELRSRATSLAMALDRPVNRQEFAIALLRNLDRSYRELLAA